ncbi:unnamed protein product [Lupinus luteus]|uniref:Uncharacterized protein n=1 Tax=Lupinus luteus TaxID=3873 RepID=A0AAV1XP41_LUPLU
MKDPRIFNIKRCMVFDVSTTKDSMTILSFLTMLTRSIEVQATSSLDESSLLLVSCCRSKKLMTSLVVQRFTMTKIGK